MIQYQYIPLEGATMVERKHPRDVQPPLMTNISNMVLSRSDNTLTLRPDWNNASVRVASYENSLELSGSEDDFLNSVTGLYGTDNKVFFTSFFPLDDSNDFQSDTNQLYSTIISKRQESGAGTTAAVTTGSPLVATSNNTFNINKIAWPGCIVQFDDDPNSKSWVIDRITDDQNFILETAADFTDAATEFTVFQNHSYDNDGYKFHIEQFLSNLIYNTPHIDESGRLSRITGPWAASITIFGTEGRFDGSEYVITSSSKDLSFGDTGLVRTKKIAAMGSNVAITFNMGTDEDVGYSATPEDIGSWANFTLDITGVNSNLYFGPIEFNSSDNKFWSCGVNTTSPGGVHTLYLSEFTDAAPPVHTPHATAQTFANYSYVTSQCYNSTDTEYWCAVANRTTYDGDQYIYKINKGTYAVTTEDMGFAVDVSGMAFSATAGAAGQIFIVGNKTSDGSPVSFLYDCDANTLTAKTLPVNISTVHDVSCYDDGATVVWTAVGDSFLAYYSYTSNAWVATDISITVEGAANSFYAINDGYDWGGGDVDNYLLMVGPSNVATVEIDVANKYPTAVVQSDTIDYTGSSYGVATPIALTGYSYATKKYICFFSDSGITETSFKTLDFSLEDTFETQSDFLQPLSSSYRSRAYAVLNGYVIMLGMYEYDVDGDGTDAWTYTPRRIRWTAPATVNDFAGIGSGTAEPKGNGEFLDARSVNGRAVTFESNQIGILVPRGIVDDPWDYEVLHEGLRIVSNPVTVNDTIYFVASDGLLWMTDGSSVQEAGSSFDATKFDDFNENKPMWLVYSEQLNSLLAFYPTGSNDSMSTISLANGGVAEHSLMEASNANAQDPKSIVANENCSDRDVYVSHNCESTDRTKIVIGQLGFGNAVTGRDYITSSDNEYWYGQFQTGKIFFVPEGKKVDLKHVSVSTYTDATSQTDCPDVIVEVKSLEDASFYSGNDSSLNGNVTINTSVAAMPNSSPVPGLFSYNPGSATGAAQTYYLPWPAANARVYTESGGTYTPLTRVTANPPTVVGTYYADGDTLKLIGTNGHQIYFYCENEPSVKLAVGDYFYSDEGYHRVTAINGAYEAALDRAKAAGSDTACEHYAAQQMQAGDGEIKIGINKSVEGVIVRVTVLPRHGSGVTGQPTVAKISGITFGFVPGGQKTLEATGG